MRTAEEILHLHAQRAKFYAPLHTAMQEISDIYSGRTTVELPEADEADPSSVPNLLAQGLDQMAGRVVSTAPMFLFAPEDPTKRTDMRRAALASKVLGAWYMLDRQPIKMLQRARHLMAYAMSATAIRWDPECHRPCKDNRSPLDTYPSLDTIRGTSMPTDVIFAYRRTIGWLVAKGYSAQVRAITGNDPNPQRDLEMLLLEYTDPDGTALVLTGYAGMQNLDMPRNLYAPGDQRAISLEFAPAPLGMSAYDMMPVSVATRMTLDKPMGQFDTMTGMYYRSAKLFALELAAVEKGIFPDTYAESRQGEQFQFISGPHDGRTGLINIVQGGVVHEIQNNPGYQTTPMLNNLERNMRVTAGIPAEFGGESGSNIRTARRGDSVMSSVIDFPLAEAQNIFSYALADENKVMIAMAKAYDGTAKRTFYVGTGNTVRPVTFTANDVFTHDEHLVTYPMPGTDINSLRVGLGQAVGMGTMSTRTASELDPTIADPELEHDRIIYEGLEHAMMAGLQQKVASGDLPPLTVAKIQQLVIDDKYELADAIVKVTEQAAATAPPAPALPPGMPGPPGAPPTADQANAPATMAGLAGAVPGAAQPQQNLAQMLQTLHRPISSTAGVT